MTKAKTPKKYKIKANIFSIENGDIHFDNVKSIRILSKKYNILIMEDYLPVIGEVDGSVSIALEDHSEDFNNIVAYYKHSKNEFELLIKEFKD